MRYLFSIFFFIFNFHSFSRAAGNGLDSPPRLSSYLAKQVASVSAPNRSLAKQAALQLQAQLTDPDKKKQLFVDLSQDVTLDVFNKPGFFNSESCESEGKKFCHVTGSVSGATEMTSTGQIKFSENTSSSGDKILTPFYEVNYIQDGHLQSGWIPGDRVSFEPSLQQQLQMQNHTSSSWLGRTCRSISRMFVSDSSSSNIDQLASIHSAYRQSLMDKLSAKPPAAEVAEKISGIIGQCVLEPVPNSIVKDKNGKISSVTFKQPKDIKGDIVYDEKVLPSLQKSFSTVRDLQIPGLNAQKIVEIDALARTIFAEIAACVPIGEQYLMAVTRVIANREAAIEKNPNAAKEFIYASDTHWPGKNSLTRLVSSPVQFSAWNKDIIDFDALNEARENRAAKLQKQKHGMSSYQAMQQAKEELKPDAQTKAFYKYNESGLKHTLCPPSDVNKPYYDGHLPSKNLNEIWKKTVQVAVEASLYPEKFNQKTESLKNVLHYTSGRSSFYNYKQVRPSVEGQKINSDRCLNLWVKPPEKKK